jgi:hypothetical protein
MISIQPKDEWKLEQGLAPAELALLDQTTRKDGETRPSALSDVESSDDDDAKADGIAKEEDHDALFAEEREGWHG